MRTASKNNYDSNFCFFYFHIIFLPSKLGGGGNRVTKLLSVCLCLLDDTNSKSLTISPNFKELGMDNTPLDSTSKPYTGGRPYPRAIRSKTYRGYVKPRIIPNATYNAI